MSERWFYPKRFWTGWRVGLAFNLLEASLLSVFWGTNTGVPAGTPIRPMGLTFWMFNLAVLALACGLRPNRIDWDEAAFGGWRLRLRAITGSILLLTPLPLSSLLLSVIVRTMGWVMGD